MGKLLDLEFRERFIFYFYLFGWLIFAFKREKLEIGKRSPEWQWLKDKEGKGYSLQHSGLENSLDLYSPWGHKESNMTE